MPFPEGGQTVALDTEYTGTRRKHRQWEPLRYLAGPTGILFLFFAGPLTILAVYSFRERSRTGDGSWTLQNYVDALQSRYLETAINTAPIAVLSMVLLLLIAYPLAYLISFKIGKREVPLLLTLALSDKLNPLIRIHPWRTVLGRNGLMNTVLEGVGLIFEPLDWPSSRSSPW